VPTIHRRVWGVAVSLYDLDAKGIDGGRVEQSVPESGLLFSLGRNGNGRPKAVRLRIDQKY